MGTVIATFVARVPRSSPLPPTCYLMSLTGPKDTPCDPSNPDPHVKNTTKQDRQLSETTEMRKIQEERGREVPSLCLSLPAMNMTVIPKRGTVVRPSSRSAAKAASPGSSWAATTRSMSHNRGAWRDSLKKGASWEGGNLWETMNSGG
jgi:hypothetical protein